MEPLGFKRGMKEIMGEGLDIEVMTTDRSTSIRKIMREEFPMFSMSLTSGIQRKVCIFCLPCTHTTKHNPPPFSSPPHSQIMSRALQHSDLYIADKRMGFGCTLQKNSTNVVVRGPNLCYIYSFRFEEEDTEERSN